MGNIKPIVFKNETPPETYKWLLKDATQLLEINKDDLIATWLDGLLIFIPVLIILLMK